MKLWLHRLSEITQLCLEAPCPLCQRSASAALCPACQQQLQRSALPNPAQFWQPPLPIFAWGQYGGSLKRVIAALKYDNHPRLAEPLAQALAQSWLKSVLSAQMPQKPVVMPIPMHPEKQRQRGFNQAELIARSFCQQTGLSLAQGLSRQRNTAPQFGLSAADRAENLADAFELRANFRGKKLPVLLLDDIYTTGATALTAAQTLRRNQISVYGILAVAKAGIETSG
jgi:ComF family protein